MAPSNVYPSPFCLFQATGCLVATSFFVGLSDHHPFTRPKVLFYLALIFAVGMVFSLRCRIDGQRILFMIGPFRYRSWRIAGSFVVVGIGPLIPTLRYPVVKTIDGDAKLWFIVAMKGSTKRFEELARVLELQRDSVKFC